MPFNLLKCTFGKHVLHQRYVLIIFMQLALLNAYHMRMVLNIAITEMVDERNSTTIVNECPQFKYQKVEKVQGGTFPWDNNMEAAILYAFFISYLVSHVPGGWLADKVGARHVMGTGMVISSLVTLAFPLGLKYGGSTAAIIMRMILGFAQGPLLPTISTFIQCWVPKNQRAFLGGIAFGGSCLGTVTGAVFTGIMIKRTGSWTLPFYVWGCFSLAFCFFYYLYVYSSPSKHPYITEEELKLMEIEIKHIKKFKVPWRKIFTSLPVWALLAGQYAHHMIFFTMMTTLPKYLKEILKMNVEENAIGTASGFFGQWLCDMFFAYFTDWLINRELITLQVARKLNTALGCLVPPSLLLVAVSFRCNRTAAITLYTVAITFLAPFYSGMKVNVNDLTTHYGGTIMAMVNGIGSTAGVVGPFMVGAFTEDESFHSWKKVFFVLFGVACVLTTVYVILAKTERQSWDYIDDQ